MTAQEQRAHRIGTTIGYIIGLPISLALVILITPIVVIEKLVNSTKGK